MGFPNLMMSSWWSIETPPFDPSLDLSLSYSRNTPFTWADVQDIDLTPDWNRMLIMYWENSVDQRLEQYDLWSPFNTTSMVTSHTFVMPSWVISSNRNSKAARYWNNWNKLFYQVNTTMYSHDLTVAYDISVRTNQQSIVIARLSAFEFNSDWTKFIWTWVNNWAIYLYTLSTAWDIMTATLTYTNSTFTITTSIEAITISQDWLYMYASHYNWSTWTTSERITRFDLWVSWDITTVTNTWLSFNPWLVYPPIFRYIESQDKWFFWNWYNQLREYDVIS